MSPSVAELIKHPERLDKDSLYGLREIVARYPYYQAARILFLQNLFILHDATFGDELRKAALYVADRRVLFKMVEGSNYEIKAERPVHNDADNAPETGGDRTVTLIDRFLQSGNAAEEQLPKRKLTLADARNDYVAYLMQMEDAEPEKEEPKGNVARSRRSSELIETFIVHKPERMVLQDAPEYVPQISEDEQEESIGEDYFTETLAKIYIKQGRYEKALEIISKLNLIYPKKNRYFADQMRFLQKLVINKKHNK